MKTLFFIMLIPIVYLIYFCQPGNRKDNEGLFFRENLLAWCIVPFDSVKRSPEERSAMLNELGFTQFAYDWREEHLPTFRTEIATLREYNISLNAVWFWINGNQENLLDSTNEFLLSVIKEENVNTELWVCFNNTFFEGLSDSECLDKAVGAVKVIHQRAGESGCSIALYNHGDWFGEPENQIRIIEESGLSDIKIIYNFHHAHHQIERFPELLEIMMPYLGTVNINGMTKGGPKILAVGSGDEEQNMMEILKKSGFNGNIGILGHTEGEDVKVVLERSLHGLNEVLLRMKDIDTLNKN